MLDVATSLLVARIGRLLSASYRRSLARVRALGGLALLAGFGFLGGTTISNTPSQQFACRCPDLSDLSHDLHGQGHVTLSVDLRNVGPGVPQGHLRGLQAEASPDFRCRRMS